MRTIAFIAKAYQDANFSTGGEKFNFILLEGLRKSGFEIDLYVDFFISENIKNFKNVYKVSEYNASNDYYRVLTEQALVASDITYIHGHSYLYRQKMMSNKFSHFLYKIFNRKKHLKRLNEFNITRKNICSTKKIIVSSKVLKKDMIDNYGVDENKVFILPPPVEKYNMVQRKFNKIFTFGISAVGFERKGGYLALKAIKILKKRGYNFKVKFIYPSKKTFIKLLIKMYGIEKYCEFLPLQKDMSKFYFDIDCLLMPSIIEPFGMVAAEALSTGCPVVTGVHCGASDIIKESQNGFLYKGNKSANNLANAMAKAYNEIINNKDEICKNCKTSVENQNTDSFTMGYIEVLHELINK